MKYLLCILSLAFLLVGVGLFSNEEDLQGFREEKMCIRDSNITSRLRMLINGLK